MTATWRGRLRVPNHRGVAVPRTPGFVLMAGAAVGAVVASLAQAPMRDDPITLAALAAVFAAGAIRRFGGITVAAPLSGQRALTPEAMDAVRPLARGFAVEAAMTIDAGRAGLRVLEVPAAVTHRPTYRDLRGFTHRGRQGIDIARAVTARLRRFR